MGIFDSGEILRKFGRRKQGEEHQRFWMWIVGGVNRAGGNVGDFARLQNAELISYPLFGATLDHVDDFFAVGMDVKRMAVHRLHVGADQEQFLGGDQIGTAQPLVDRPGVWFAESIRFLHKTTIGG